ncbi:MAG: hypothetical protein AAGJ28_23580 [Pseudomonadota bacterium]
MEQATLIEWETPYLEELPVAETAGGETDFFLEAPETPVGSAS